MKKYLKKTLLATSVCFAIGLSACSTDGTGPTFGSTPVAPAVSGHLLTSDNKLVPFSISNPSYNFAAVSITGLNANDVLMDIDGRPADGRLYALGVNNTTATVYEVNTTTGAATVLSQFTVGGGTYNIDFNPTIDRLRVIGSLSNTTPGENFAVNVNSGAATAQTAVNPATANIASNAYTDTLNSVGTTSLYTIDVAGDTLNTQNPAASGTQTVVAPLGVDATAVAGFDIAPGTTTTPNTRGYAVMTVAGTQALYSISLNATAAPAVTQLGAIPTLPAGVTVKGLALNIVANPNVYALADNNQFYAFRKLFPSSLSTPITIDAAGTALNPMEKVIGMDFALKAFDQDAMGNPLAPSSGLFVITDQNRVLRMSTAGVLSNPVPLVDNMGMPYDLQAATVGYSIDFNPTIPAADALNASPGNRLRVVAETGSTSSHGRNLAINLDFTDIAGTPTRGVVTEQTKVSTANPSGVQLIGHAYLNSAHQGNDLVAGTTTFPATTSLYALDSMNFNLGTQTVSPANPATDGQFTALAPLGASLIRPAGFDIAGRFNDHALVLGKTAAGSSSTLYSVNLAATSPTNALTSFGTVGSSTAAPINLIDLAIQY